MGILNDVTPWQKIIKEINRTISNWHVFTCQTKLSKNEKVIKMKILSTDGRKYLHAVD